MNQKPIPNIVSPGLRIQLLDGSYWSLNNLKAENFGVIIFYRGKHCPICKEHLKKLDDLVPEFLEQGVELIAVSANHVGVATKTQEEWELKNLRLGCGLTETQMNEWGLYISEKVKDPEPDVFCEPGMFIVRSNDLKLYSASLASSPFCRPEPQDLLDSLKFIIEEEYPARGTRMKATEMVV